MWKKEDGMPGQAPAATVNSPEAPRAPVVRTVGHATIGPSIVVRGEVSGDEDLLIQGQLDGSVALDLHAVTVGGGGRVKADITGRIITIEGSVEGNLQAKEQIILRGSATVHGDLKAPRVVLEDGASFRGLVDMGLRDSVAGGESRRAEKAAKAPTSAAVSGPPAAGRPAAAVSPPPDAGFEKAPPSTAARPVATKGKDASGTGVGR